MASMKVVFVLVTCLCPIVQGQTTNFNEADEMERLHKAQEALISFSVGLDTEEVHLIDLHKNEDLPSSFRRVLDSIITEAESCEDVEKYRRADGVCNNQKEPLWGASLHIQQRLLPNAYMDGVRLPRMVGKSKKYLPSSRKVSTNCFPPNEENTKFLDRTTSQMSMQWGQYIDHDLVLTEVSPGSNCCQNSHTNCLHPDVLEGGPCFPIHIPADDRYFNGSCMSFRRSFSIEENGVHEQISGVTSFVDASTVYGSHQSHSDKLRTFSQGKLKVEDDNTLPREGTFKCREVPHHASACPFAGEGRVNVFPGLTLLHLLFVREHNRIAEKLAEVNSEWSDETLFQEARRIIVALHQKITFDDFLPHVIGPDAIKAFGLEPDTFEYDQMINPSIINEFAAAAFRYGHSQINGLMNMDHSNTPISDLFFFPTKAMDSERRIKTIMKDQCKKHAQKTNKFFSTQVTDLLFHNVDAPFHSTDLAARNVQRGRDHGLPPYLDYMDLALQNFARSNSSINNVKLPDCLAKNVYESVYDIDLYAGALDEEPMAEALVGPTFAYIIGEQFRRLKNGDRYFYETKQSPIAFTADQLNEIKRMSLSHVICRNTFNHSIQKNVFAVPDRRINHVEVCENYRDINFELWRDVKK